MPLPRGHEDLLDVRLRVARHAPDRRRHRSACRASRSTRQPFLHHDPLHDALRTQPRVRFHRQEHHADAVLPGRRQREAQFGALAGEELVRNLDQHAGAVAGFRIAAARSAMRQIDQNLYALDDNIVRFLTFDVGDEADAAGIVLVAGIVKSLRGR